MKYKLEVYEKMMESRVVAVLGEVPQNVPLAKALVDGGIKAIEVTMDTEKLCRLLPMSVKRWARYSGRCWNSPRS